MDWYNFLYELNVFPPLIWYESHAIISSSLTLFNSKSNLSLNSVLRGFIALKREENVNGSAVI